MDLEHCDEVCRVCQDGWRFFKVCVAFVMGLVGMSMAFEAKEIVKAELKAVLQESFAYQLSSSFTISGVFTVFVNIVAFMYCFIGIPCVHSCIFSKGWGDKKCRYCQCCLGSSFFALFMQLATCATVISQVVFANGYLILDIALGFLNGFCRGGDTVIARFQALLDSYAENMQSDYQEQKWSPVNWFVYVDVNTYCLATASLGDAAHKVFVGCSVAVISQLLMLMVVSEEKGRFAGHPVQDDHYEMREHSSSRRERRRRQEEFEYSSSSEDSDYEPDPKRKKNRRSPHASHHVASGYQPSARFLTSGFQSSGRFLR